MSDPVTPTNADLRIVSVHLFRARARDRERSLEALLKQVRSVPAMREEARRRLREAGVPAWAEHVRVQRYRGKRRGRWAVAAR
jgi:endonuclease/exonuclease/phosphatase family metal-dependent hydrolase